MSFELQLVDKLIKFCDEEISKLELKNWVTVNSANLKAVLSSPGKLLKVKNGDRNAITCLIAEITQDNKSDAVFPEGPFNDLDAYLECEAAIEKAVAEKVLEQVDEPHWYTPASFEIGAAGFFKAIATRSIWCLNVPERAFKGGWRKVG